MLPIRPVEHNSGTGFKNLDAPPDSGVTNFQAYLLHLIVIAILECGSPPA